ncbi:uncharacterized protein IUM83_02108 [Phytophthora cinnamomi]|uniref:uncharacterized protein n=1 Tax=Phytophthora cinnamomi TaxID=4785 RepID=UPI002A353594|nr:hypothetical protein IUM83_02108 [Phytophthora cinnamomi]KAJ8575849.1 hypothetical protein ON010_g3363 [Phytophthora cinnamomi]
MEDFGPEVLSGLLQHLDDIYDSLSSSESDDSFHVGEHAVLLAPRADKPPQHVFGDNLVYQTKPVREMQARGRIVGPLPYSTELQRRKKAELGALRLEVQQLSTRLAHIVKNSDENKALDSAEELPEARQRRRVWYSRVMDECEARASAERTNKELKAVLLQNFKAFRFIRKELRAKDVLKGLEFVSQSSPTVDLPFFQMDFCKPMFEELASHLDKLYLGSGELLPPSTNSISVRCQRKRHETGEHFMEVASNTPVACPVHEAGDFLWRFITKSDDADNESSFNFARVRPVEDCDLSQEMQYTLSLFVQNLMGAPLCIEAISRYRKHVEPNRFVVVGTIRWLLPTDALDFEDKYWTIISPAPTDPNKSCVVQSYYQLHENLEGTMAAERKDALMYYIANITRSYLQLLQEAILSIADLHQPECR